MSTKPVPQTLNQTGVGVSHGPQSAESRLPPPASLSLTKSLKEQTSMAETCTHEQPDSRVNYYFFYGSLMDHAVLSRALQQPHRPEIYPATVEGWQCKMWGEYPALVRSPGNNV
jgi:hypothetical protein